MTIAWIEEWMSLRAYYILPILSKKFDIIYVVGGNDIPKANFKEVYRFPRRKLMNLGAIELSSCVNKLYREKKVNFACTYASIGFLLKIIPYVNLLGGCAFENFKVFYLQKPIYSRPRSLIGFFHYVIPEYIACKRAAKVIAISDSLKLDLIKHYKINPEDIYVVHNGVGEEYFQVFKNKKINETIKLVYIGRLHFSKGILKLIKEFSKRRELPAEFFVLGEGHDYKEVNLIAKQDNRIKLFGHLDRNELLKILETTNVFIWPTLYEGFGNGLSEAMASGHACLAYDTSVNREILGDSGILCQYNNFKEIVEKIDFLIKNPHIISNLAQKAHERIKKYSWKNCAGGIEKIFNDMHIYKQ